MRVLVLAGLLVVTACGSDVGGAEDIDAGPEAACDDCGDGERCVVHCGGTGRIVRAECVATSCDTSCTESCEAELCDEGFSCEYGCTSAPAGAFECAGP